MDTPFIPTSKSNPCDLNVFGLRKTRENMRRTYKLHTCLARNEPSASCSEPPLCLQQVLPSLLPLVRLYSATAGSRCRLGPAPASWPAPSPRPAGPGTGRGFSLQLPVPQTADRAPTGRSTASWLHICRTEVI